jgi:hypothetical protein
MLALCVKLFLDKTIKTGRIDKWLLRLLIVKNISIQTQVTLKSKVEPKLKDIKKICEETFEEGFDKLNEINTKNNTYKFKLNKQNIPIQIRVFDPEGNKDYSIKVEMLGEDKYGLFNNKNFDNNLDILQTLVNKLKEYDLDLVHTEIKINERFKKMISDIEYTYNKKIKLNNNYISIPTKDFRNLKEDVKLIIREWIIKFL